MNEWDAYSVDESTAARTIFVDNAGLTATDFDLTPAQQDELFLNGVRAATAFVIEMGGRGHVPRSAQEAIGGDVRVTSVEKRSRRCSRNCTTSRTRTMRR